MKEPQLPRFNPNATCTTDPFLEEHFRRHQATQRRQRRRHRLRSAPFHLEFWFGFFIAIGIAVAFIL